MTSESSVIDVATARVSRIARIRERMTELGIEVLLLSIGADLPWCCGYEAMPLERPTVLVLPSEGEATLVVPFLEAPRVLTDARLFRMRPWRESEDAVAIIADLVGARTHLGVSDRAFAALLLGLQRALPDAKWNPASIVTGPLRAVKDAAEIAALAAAAQAADSVARSLLAGEIPLVGRTEAAVSATISARLIDAGHERVNFAIVGSGPNSASPHHSASDRVIGEREAVVCDFGGSFRLGGDVGYCSDITRTVVTGDPPAEFSELYVVLEEAQRRAVDAVAPGVSCEEIDHVGRSIISKAGYGEFFIHRTGHGIGIEEHEDPYIVAGNSHAVLAGEAFSIEPGIYIAGRFGARIEDIVVARNGGVDSLNCADHALHIVEA